MPNLPIVKLRPEYYQAGWAKAEAAFREVMRRKLRAKGGQENVSQSKELEERRRGALGEAAVRQFLWYPPPPPYEDFKPHDVGPFDVKTRKIYRWRTGHYIGGDLLIPIDQRHRKEFYMLVHQLPGITSNHYVLTGYIEASRLRDVGERTAGFRRGGDCWLIKQTKLHDIPDHPPWRLKDPPWQEQAPQAVR